MDPNHLSRRSVCGALGLIGLAGAAPAASPAAGPARIEAIVFDALGTLFDTAAIRRALEALVPRLGGRLADVWRLKQLEYTWLSASAQSYVPLAEITRRSLDYAMASVGVMLGEDQIGTVLAAYGRLPCFPDVPPALAALGGQQLAILSASGPALLDGLLRANRLDGAIRTVLSTEVVRSYKPSPLAYGLAQRTLRRPPATILLVSANAFDVWGAARFGFRTAWLRRPDAAAEPGLYDLLRAGPETLSPAPGRTLSSLAELPGLVAA